MKIAKGDYVILVDDDVIVTEGWLEALIEAAESDKRIGIVGAKIFDKDGNLNHTGGDISLYEFGWHHKEDIDKITERTYVTSAVMLITRQALHTIGKFDENFKKYGLDADYCIRAWEKGLKVVCTPKCVVTHLVGGTINLRKDKQAVWEADRKYFNKKWFEGGRFYEAMDKRGN